MDPFAILDKLFDPARPCFTPETAENVLALESDPAIVARLDVLGEKANEGQLTRAEESEYWRAIHVGKLISILQLQARLYLKRASA